MIPFTVFVVALVALILFYQPVRNVFLAGIYLIGAASPTLGRWATAIGRRGLIIIIIALSTIALFLILTGYAIVVVYAGIIGFLFIFLILSFWITPLRPILMAILVVGALFYFGKEVVSEKAIPFVNNYISGIFSNFPEWKVAKQELINNGLREDIVSASQEIMTSSPFKGKFGILIEDSVAYDDHGSVIAGIQLKKGHQVMSVDMKGTFQESGTEGMALVSVANKYGDFVESRRAYVPVRKIQWESSGKEGNKTSSAEPPEWELVKEYQIHFNGRVFSETVGPNGERPHTGEVYPGCFVEVGYRYKISYSGDYSKYFLSGPWYNNISWQGWTPQNANVKLPYPKYQNMSLVLRIGNVEGLHPEKGQDFIVFVPTEAAKIFAELNINREAAEYYHPTEGLKIKNSTLSIKIERQPL